MEKCIYVVATPSGRVKVGVAKDATRRLGSLRTGSSEPLSLYWSARCPVGTALRIERVAHAALADMHVNGEWFAGSPEAVTAKVIATAAEMGHSLIAEVPLTKPQMEHHPWQQRMRAAGLSQRVLARLMGYAEITVSRQLRGHFENGSVPRHVVQAIRAWEIMTPEQREHWLQDE